MAAEPRAAEAKWSAHAPLRLLPPHVLYLGFRPLRAEPQRALQDPCSSCYAQCANLPSAVMPMCQQTCDRGPCGSNMPQGEPTGGDPCMHVDCSMLSDAMQATEPCCRGGTGGDEEEGPPEW